MGGIPQLPLDNQICIKLVGGLTLVTNPNNTKILNSFKIYEQWPDFGCEGIKVQRAHQPTSQCQGNKKKFMPVKMLIFMFLTWLHVAHIQHYFCTSLLQYMCRMLVMFVF
eukprot:TRINITY_DN14979_c0_g1_i2.p5 TRINITY_DN14979_c0_g1~~TRINITY_DN14979_c0_g1_i2.p5  ORF type:complete len:110 (+),score=8.45 TRINITY_DN14979_c0_g1_i2:1273-1602(+)